nr:hypothetical protein [uncultured Dyadobacter sp.]
MREILTKIVLDRGLHEKWLNTLSFMENAGARKISACEDPMRVGIVQLKHAAEEHRHAYYLKKQIQKLDGDGQSFELLAPVYTRHYLHNLDMQCSRYLKKHFGLVGSGLKYASYLFVTYAIEVRADALYPAYQDVLTAQRSKISVKSIIAEEEGHLEEMLTMLALFDPRWEEHAAHLLTIEAGLFEGWFNAISTEVAGHEYVGVAVA